MDEEIEEGMKNVKQTDSQKSVATSIVYSLDFTDSSSDKNNSSGMETYVLEWDSECSESPRSKGIAILTDVPAKSINVNRDIQCEVTKKVCQESSTSFNKCSIVAQEIFTQTSKTIIELAESEGAVKKSIDCNTLETQTSFLSIRENKTVEYRIEVTSGNKSYSKCSTINDCDDNFPNTVYNQFVNSSLEDGSSKLLQISETDSANSEETVSPASSEKVINIINDESKETITCEDQNEYECNSDFDESIDTTDIEEDSLMEPAKPKDNPDEDCTTPKSVDKDVAELYSKLYESIEFHSHRPYEMERRQFGYLTPLMEESVVRKESPSDMTSANIETPAEEDKDVLFTNKAGIKVKLFPEEPQETEAFKLPPIQNNHGGPNNANLDFLFSQNSNKLQLRTGLPSVYDDRREDRPVDRWEMGARELASGESVLISGRNEHDKGAYGAPLLPPIHLEGYTSSSVSKTERSEYLAPEIPSPINIKDKIKELKQSHRSKTWQNCKYSVNQSESRSGSPSTLGDDTKTSDIAERGCDLLCAELLKRLRSASWYDVTDTLEDIPRALEKFWGIIPENRIADLLRQVTSHAESPRTQIARAACNTLSVILMNTNYTKKPDFYEAVTILLIKTGSFSRPVRRAANVALDNIVCGVDLSHVVTVLCIHGATHKSALVRCASARLLVVCCALGGGGRELLRARPPSAACARRHALRSLSILLEDKSMETRKYAERLYSMLRPLSNFEAYYLTDVDIELASRQMKKYDQLLLCGPPEPR